MFMTWCFPPGLSVFGGQRFQSASLTGMNISGFSHPATTGLALASSSYPTATSAAAVTGLSYSAIHPGCPRWYQPFQVSPNGLTAFRTVRTAYQSGPSCTLSSTPRWGFSAHFVCGRIPPVSGTFVHPPLVRFRVAQSHQRCGLGRTGHCSPERPLQRSERNYPHCATAYVRPGSVGPGLVSW